MIDVSQLTKPEEILGALAGMVCSTDSGNLRQDGCGVMDEYTIPYGRNNYCGPCALAYILRTDPDSAAAKLREVSGKKAIRGTALGFAAFLFIVRALYAFDRPTLDEDIDTQSDIFP